MTTTVLPASTSRPSDVSSLRDVVEVQAGGGLVEDVEGAAGLAAGQLARELDALRLAAGQRGRALAERGCSRGRRRPAWSRMRNEARVRAQHGERLVHREVEHVGDAAPVEQHLQRLAVVAPAAAGPRSATYTSGRKCMLDRAHAVALAGLAAPALRR